MSVTCTVLDLRQTFYAYHFLDPSTSILLEDVVRSVFKGRILWLTSAECRWGDPPV